MGQTPPRPRLGRLKPKRFSVRSGTAGNPGGFLFVRYVVASACFSAEYHGIKRDEGGWHGMEAHKIYQLHGLLRGRRTVASLALIMEHLECSRATAGRVIREMRDYLQAPIDYDREYKGYRYGNARYELPGLWFSTEEILALLSMQKLLAEVGAGLLDAQLNPLRQRIEKLLESKQFFYT